MNFSFDTPPHDTELENRCLAAILRDPEYVLPLCRETMIEPEAFYGNNHRVAYSAAMEVAQADGDAMVDDLSAWERMHSADPSLADDIKAWVLKLPDTITSTAMAHVWLKRLNTLAGARKMLRSSREIAEIVQSGDLSGAKEITDRMAEDAVRYSSAHLRSILASRRFDFRKQPEPERCIYTLGTVEVSHPGNIGVVKARPKDGKSAFTAAAIASTLAENGDFLGWQSLNTEGYGVIHLDTEQSRGDHDAMNRRILRRAGQREAPNWLQSYCLTGFTPKECTGAMEMLLEDISRRFGGVHSVWLDGVADFVSSPNDEQESMAMVTKLHGLAIKFDTAIWGVLHVNPGSETGKMRGHIGSQIERKAETVLAMEKDEDGVTKVWTQPARRVSIPKFRAIRFEFSEKDGMHMTCHDVGERPDTRVERTPW